MREKIIFCFSFVLFLVLGALDGQGLWKDPGSISGEEEDIKPTVHNGLSTLNGSAFGMNPLLQGSMLGMNGFSENFPFGKIVVQGMIILLLGMYNMTT